MRRKQYQTPLTRDIDAVGRVSPPHGRGVSGFISADVIENLLTA
jgi:hypothetical protein